MSVTGEWEHIYLMLIMATLKHYISLNRGSEDTILFVMKEIYSGLGISTDSQVPQQSMTIERPSSRTNSIGQSLLPM